jgi:hydroxypyruvate isomerase
MPRFAANLTMLFNEVPFLDRFERAARAGFETVEFLFPYAYPVKEVVDRLRANHLRLVLHNLPAGDWEAGERGIACLPDRVEEFRDGVASDDMLRKTFVGNLKYAAAQLKKANLKLLIEPINTFDIPGFYLNRTAQAISIIEEVGSDNLFLQYDIYHAQRFEGELAATMQKHLARIGHIQVADNPGRNEPGTGEINYAFLFDHLDRIGYQGYVGCEYKPAGTTESGLPWLERARRSLKRIN